MAASRSRELFTLTILVIALGSRLDLRSSSASQWPWERYWPNGGRPFRLQLPRGFGGPSMRDAFAVLFFVSVGMLFEPSSILSRPAPCAHTGAGDDR